MGLGQAVLCGGLYQRQDTLVYGDSRSTDAFALKGTGVNDIRAAEAGPDSPFHYNNPA